MPVGPPPTTVIGVSAGTSASRSRSRRANSSSATENANSAAPGTVSGIDPVLPTA